MRFAHVLLSLCLVVLTAFDALRCFNLFGSPCNGNISCSVQCLFQKVCYFDGCGNCQFSCCLKLQMWMMRPSVGGGSSRSSFSCVSLVANFATVHNHLMAANANPLNEVQSIMSVAADVHSSSFFFLLDATKGCPLWYFHGFIFLLLNVVKTHTSHYSHIHITIE